MLSRVSWYPWEARPFLKGNRSSGAGEEAVGTGRSGGKENCGLHLLCERRIDKKERKVKTKQNAPEKKERKGRKQNSFFPSGLKSETVSWD